MMPRPEVRVTSVSVQFRRGACYDSVVLMQLQKALLALPALLDAGVVMGTEANKEVLQQSNLLTADAQGARSEDLIVAVSAESAAAPQAALDQVSRQRVSSPQSRFRHPDAAPRAVGSPISPGSIRRGRRAASPPPRFLLQ